MLELKNISYVINEKGKKKHILKNINLKLDANKIVVITGQNGSGKTTLVKIIMGILKPSKGEIYFNGENITNLTISERAQKGMAFAFQQPVKFKGLTVEKMIATALGKSITPLIGEVCGYLSKVGLCARDYIKREIDSSLSGGELKRIEIATALARGAILNIFDEPEAGIDIWSFDNLINIFQDLKAERKGLTLIVSHQEKILEIADEIIVIGPQGLKTYGVKDKDLNILKQPQCVKLKT